MQHEPMVQMDVFRERLEGEMFAFEEILQIVQREEEFLSEVFHETLWYIMQTFLSSIVFENSSSVCASTIECLKNSTIKLISTELESEGWL